MRVVGAAREGVLGEADLERMRSHCGGQAWELAPHQLWTSGTPNLGSLVAKVSETGASGVLLAREALAELEEGYPNMWAAVRARFERQRVLVVAI